MDIVNELISFGFNQVVILDGRECGISEKTILLALKYYTPQLPPDAVAHIHPYYLASQLAYRAAEKIVRQAQQNGIELKLRDEIRVKPIFARLKGFSQGRNTISYIPQVGSRFHVQIMTYDDVLNPTHHLEDIPHHTHCGTCTLCMNMCPTHAIDEEGFHRERCLRNWQLGGKSVPVELRSHMGSRLIGCDECQRCCPHNPSVDTNGQGIEIASILMDPKNTSNKLKDEIGANLAIPNRVLAQTLLIAGCSGQKELLPLIVTYIRHPSPVVSEHAEWAYKKLKDDETE